MAVTPPNSNDRSAETWPRKLNKVLIAIGVIAFGLIVTDRLLEAFRADDPPVDTAVIEQEDGASQTAPETVATAQSDAPGEQAATATTTEIVDSQSAQQRQDASASNVATTDLLDAAADLASVEAKQTATELAAAKPDLTKALAASGDSEAGDREVLVELEQLFGSRVVFVSASEPVFIVTEDERRFEVGSTVDEQTTLAGVTAQQLILEKSGDLMVISLPDPTVR